MSKERKFHEWIEQQNREEKDRVWAKIRQKEAERLAVQEEETDDGKAPVLPTARFSWRKCATIAATSLAVVLLGAFAIVKIFPFDDGITNSSSGDQGGRYFDVQSYDMVETQTTLKEYAQKVNENLLYFDWYTETDYLKNQVWQLKDTKEIICYTEEIIDINTGCMVYLFVTDSDTRIEAFSSYDSTNREDKIEEVIIHWRSNNDDALANFVYEDHRYYLRVKDPLNENYILSLVEELLS